MWGYIQYPQGFSCFFKGVKKNHNLNTGDNDT